MSSYKTEILEQLVQAAVAVDGAAPKIYWHLLEKPRVRPWDFWLCDEEKLIAYFGAYEFETNTAEITGAVHPEYRNQKIFKNFLEGFRQRHPELKKITLVGSSSKITEKVMKKLKAKFIESEFEMSYSVIPAKAGIHAFSLDLDPRLRGGDAKRRMDSRFRGNDGLSLANSADLNELLKIDLACFASDQHQVKADLQIMLQDPAYKIYLFYIQNKAIGKIHLRFDQQKIMLSDLCILPECQKQGFGNQMLQSVFALFEHEREFCVDVHAANRGALAFYESLGFAVKNEYRYFLL